MVTLAGADVDFLIDDTQPGLALYAMPTVIGNSLLFSPTTFRAESDNGAGTVSQHGTIAFDVVAHSGATAVGALEVSEAGDYFISSASGGSVGVVAQLGALNLNAADPAASYRQDLRETGPLTAEGANAWHLATGLDLASVWFDATRVRVDIQNNLSATSLIDPSQSWIEKKFEGMRVQVQVVPLPGTFWLLLSALGALVAGRAVSRRLREGPALAGGAMPPASGIRATG